MHDSSDDLSQDPDRPSTPTSTPTRNMLGDSLQAIGDGMSMVPVDADAIGHGIAHGLEASGELAAGFMEVLSVGVEGSAELMGAVVEAIGGILGGLLSGL